MQPQDERYLDAIDRAIDGTSVGSSIPGKTLETIAQLRAMAGRVELTNGKAAIGRSQSVAAKKRAYRWQFESVRTSRRLPALVTAALAILLVAVLARDWKDEDGSLPSLAVSSWATPQFPQSGCATGQSGAPYPTLLGLPGQPLRTKSYWIPAPAVPDVAVQVMKRSDLEIKGDAVQHETYIDVLAIVQARIDCMRAGGADWKDAQIGSVLDASTQESAELVLRTASISILSMREIDEQLIAVLLSTDLYGAGLLEYDLFYVENGGARLIDFTLVGDDAIIDNALEQPIPAAASIELPHLLSSQITLAADSTVSLRITNSSEMALVFRATALDLWDYLEPGESTTLSFSGPPGAYVIELVVPGVQTFSVESTLTLVAP